MTMAIQAKRAVKGQALKREQLRIKLQAEDKEESMQTEKEK